MIARHFHQPIRRDEQTERLTFLVVVAHDEALAVRLVPVVVRIAFILNALHGHPIEHRPLLGIHSVELIKDFLVRDRIVGHCLMSLGFSTARRMYSGVLLTSATRFKKSVP